MKKLVYYEIIHAVTLQELEQKINASLNVDSDNFWMPIGQPYSITEATNFHEVWAQSLGVYEIIDTGARQVRNCVHHVEECYPPGLGYQVYRCIKCGFEISKSTIDGIINSG